MKYIYYIFVLYFFSLVLLPSIQGCFIPNITHNNELPCDKDPCNQNSDTCSPFCGQAGCGIVINEVNTQNTIIVDFPEQEYKFVYFKDDHIKSISSRIWHPPKV